MVIRNRKREPILLLQLGGPTCFCAIIFAAMIVYFMSGGADPVGDYGAGVERAYKAFCDAGLKDVSIKLYPDGRHEMLNELNREEVKQDILNWINEKLKKIA